MFRLKLQRFFIVPAICLLMWGSLPLFAADVTGIDDIEFITENYPPNNFEENGALKGIWVDVLVAVLERMGAAQGREDIKLMPWARGYRAVQNMPNTCLFVTTRTIERESLFKWAGPVNQANNVLISLKEKKLSIEGIDDLAGFRIGVVKDDVAELLLLNNGIPKDQLVYSFGEHPVREILMKLNNKAIDLWGVDQISARWLLETYGLDSGDYKAVFKVASTRGYFAFSKATPDHIVKAFRIHLDTVMKSDLFQTIQDRYLANVIFHENF